MSDLSDHYYDAKLLEEMQTLVDRYGLSNCDRALNEVARRQEEEAQALLTTKTWDFSDPGRTRCIAIDTNELEDGFGLLWRAFFFGHSQDNLNLRFYSNGSEPDFVLDVFEDYYEYLVNLHPLDPSLEDRRVRSRFHSLYLQQDGPYDVVLKLLERKEVIALFRHVEIVAFCLDPHWHREFMPMVRDLVVNDGVISSLTVYDQSLNNDNVIAMGEMLRTNQLHSFRELYGEVEDSIRRFDSPNDLIQGLQTHVQLYAERSILRELEIFNFCEIFSESSHDNTNNERRQFFDIIGSLPRLKLFSMGVNDPHSFESWAIGIHALKVDDFKIEVRRLGDDDNNDIDFRPIFDAVATSKYLKCFEFSLDRNRNVQSLPVSVTRQIFSSLVLSSSSGLLKIVILYKLDLRLLTTVISEDGDWDTTSRGQLRCLKFYDGGPDFWKQEFESSDSPYLYLLERHPFLYQLGHYTWSNRRFGESLFDDDILPTVPTGLWPIVLNKALTSPYTTAEEYSAATSFVFQTIKKLANAGILASRGEGPSSSDQRSHSQPPTSKRQKRNVG